MRRVPVEEGGVSMERFTFRDKDGTASIFLDESSEWTISRNANRQYTITGEAIDRLAAYEDTGLEPEDLKKTFNETAIIKLAAQALNTTPEHLRDLLQAEQDGRLVVLPCNVGDVVFAVDCEYLDCNNCDMLENGKYCPYIDKPICPKGTVRRRTFHYSLIPYLGKTVFLTREEAEAALAQKGGNHEADSF